MRKSKLIFVILLMIIVAGCSKKMTNKEKQNATKTAERMIKLEHRARGYCGKIKGVKIHKVNHDPLATYGPSVYFTYEYGEKIDNKWIWIKNTDQGTSFDNNEIDIDLTEYKEELSQQENNKKDGYLDEYGKAHFDNAATNWGELDSQTYMQTAWKSPQGKTIIKNVSQSFKHINDIKKVRLKRIQGETEFVGIDKYPESTQQWLVKQVENNRNENHYFNGYYGIDLDEGIKQRVSYVTIDFEFQNGGEYSEKGLSEKFIELKNKVKLLDYSKFDDGLYYISLGISKGTMMEVSDGKFKCFHNGQYTPGSLFEAQKAWRHGEKYDGKTQDQIEY